MFGYKIGKQCSNALGLQYASNFLATIALVMILLNIDRTRRHDNERATCRFNQYEILFLAQRS